MDVIPPIEHHEVLVLLVQLAALLFVARALGHVATRFGLPSVVGELSAGIVLGPTILGAALPGVFAWVFPPNPAQFHLLEVVSFLGVMMLLVLTGLETDLGLIARKGRQAAQVSLGGIVVPFATGFGVALVLPLSFIAQPDRRLVFALFMGTAMSISAIPVIAKVMIELKVIRRDIGQLTLAAGMIDDTIGWVLLSVVAGLARSGAVNVGEAATAIISVVAFLGLAFTLGRKLVAVVLRWVDNNVPGDGAMISALFILALTFAAISQALRIEAVLGAFVLGIIVGQIKRFNHHLVQLVETIAMAVFAPIFFAAAGLRVDLGALAQPRVALVGLLVLAIAIFGKFVGAYIGARSARLGHWEALSLGAGMNARGALEIIVATIGLSLGVLTPEMFTIIVMVAIVTSLMAPPILRFTLARIEMTPEERDRLEGEERRRHSFLGNVHRVLLPTRGGGNSQVAAQIVSKLAAGEELEVSVLQVLSVPDRVPSEPVAAGGVGAEPALGTRTTDRAFAHVEHHLGLPRHAMRRLVRTSQEGIATAVIGEAGRGYDLLVTGATETRETDGSDGKLFSRFVDEVIQESPCPVLVVSSRTADDPSAPLPERPIRRILLPTTGSEVNRRAAEVAFSIARNDPDVVVDVVHIVIPPQTGWSQIALSDVESARVLGEEVVRQEAELGHRIGATVHTEVLVTDEPLQLVISERALTTGADLIVLRSDVRPVTRRAFFGQTIDHILRHAPCPVAIISGA